MKPLLLDVPAVEVRDRTYAVLLGLGATFPQVVDELFRLGVRGTPGDRRRCVVAVFLHDECRLPVAAVHPGYDHHDAGSPRVRIPGFVEFDTVPTETGQLVPDPLPLPPAVDELVSRFDMGLLPELDVEVAIA